VSYPAAPYPYACQPLPPRRPRSHSGLLLAAGALMLVGLFAISVVAYVTGRGPTVEDAQRECRTAFNKEFADREQLARTTSYPSSSVVTSLTDIELQEARRTDTGFEVNGVVRYDLVTVLLPAFHSSLNLTCVASEKDGELVTSVHNRW
jgi:hypothetical protein